MSILGSKPEEDPVAKLLVSDFLLPVQEYDLKTRTEILSDLVFELIEDKVRRNGSIEKTIEEARKRRDGEFIRQKNALDAKFRERKKRQDEMERTHSEIVKKIFSELFRPEIAGQAYNWDEKITFDTPDGPATLRLEEEIIDRATEFDRDPQHTRKRLINNYLNFGYPRVLETDDKRSWTTVYVGFVLADQF